LFGLHFNDYINKFERSNKEDMIFEFYGDYFDPKKIYIIKNIIWSVGNSLQFSNAWKIKTKKETSLFQFLNYRSAKQQSTKVILVRDIHYYKLSYLIPAKSFSFDIEPFDQSIITIMYNES
jgi:hypothetical protein